jgi:hypothetical protein
LTYLELILLTIIALLLAVIGWMAFKLYSLGVTILNVQDTLEDSIEVLDDKVESMERILEIPLFSDSPEIKTLRRDMIACRDATLDIAYSLSNSLERQFSEEAPVAGEQQ